MAKEFTPIGKAVEHIGKAVNIRGWVHRIRTGKDMAFVVLRDSTGTVQCVINSQARGFEQAMKSQIEASAMITGVPKEDKRAPGGIEISAESFEVVGPSEQFPITEYQSTEHLLDVRHLWIRSQRLTNIFKIRSEVTGAIHSFFRSKGFFEIQSPSITNSACEGGSTLFKVDYFGEKAYLTQSWQLYAEAMIASLEKIYCIAPSFRAERSRTRRHLAEYWHAEAEMAWYDHNDNLKLQEGLISFVVGQVLEKRQNELKLLNRDTKPLENVKPPFQRVRYQEALDILNKKGIKMKWGDDMGADEERVLTAEFDRPFFIVEFPKESKAFYMKVNPMDAKTVLCDDCLAPEGYGEIIGGSERETDPDILVQKIKAAGGNPKDYGWYLDLRKFGSVPHSGFGLGVERLVMWICGLDHIRDAIAFPRTINRVYP